MAVGADGILDVVLLSWQITVLAWKAEWGALRGGKGSGKTIVLCFWMLIRLELFPKAAHYVVGADYEQLRRGFFQSFVDVLTGIGWEEGVDFRYREVPSPMVVLPSGARLRALSSVLALRIESVEFQTLLLEEPQTYKHGEAIYGILNTRLRHSKRSTAAYGLGMPLMGRMSFNPPRKGTWLHRLVSEQWPAYGYPELQVSVKQNSLLLDQPGYIQRIQRAYPPHLWDSQIDGHWLVGSGGAIREFNCDVHGLLSPSSPPQIPRGIDRRVPLIWGLDFNVGHMRSVIAQAYVQQIYRHETLVVFRDRPPRVREQLEIPGWQRHVLRFVGEISLDDTGSRQVAEEFVRRYGEIAKACGGVILVGDSSGGNRSQIDGIATNWSTVMDTLDRHGIRYDYQVMTNGPVAESLIKFDALFRNGDGFGVTVDLPACPEFVLDLENCETDKNGGLDKSDTSDAGKRRTHALDAGRYISVWFHAHFARAEARTANTHSDPVLSR